MTRALVSFRGFFLLFGLVAVGLPVALVWQLGIVRTISAQNTSLMHVREAQLAAADVLQLQTDEETGIRGFSAAHDRLFLEPYHRARLILWKRLDDLRRELIAAQIRGSVLQDVERVRTTNADWLETVAEPVIAGRGGSLAVQVRGKVLVDNFRDELEPIRRALDERFAALLAKRDEGIRNNSRLTLGGIGVIALELLAFAIVVARLQHELDRERAVTEELQRAAAGRLVPPPHLAIGTAYRSATRGARVGGDVYDVYRVDDERTLIVVGDVSGKGVTAAVDTTFVRYAIRALAAEQLSPQEIVTRFDALYRAADGPPESFVTLFVGIHDRRTALLTYVNAGHEACWVRRWGALEELAPTGPLIGLGGVSFSEAETALGEGAMLVLATDGLTEARDPSGGFVAAERVRRWIAETDSPTPQRFVDALVGAVAQYVRGRISDDLAVLAVTPV